MTCVNCVISKGVKGPISDGKGWEKKPKVQIALGYSYQNF